MKYKTDYEFFIQNKADLIEKYFGQFIIIKDQVVVGAFNSLTEAMVFGLSNFEKGTFTVEECVDSSFEPQVFHSRVIFI